MERAMAKAKIETNLLGRKVKLGWSFEQCMDWRQEPGNDKKNLSVKTVPDTIGKHGKKEGTIVAVWVDDGHLVCGVEVEGSLVELSPRFHFDLIPQ
jgi:hypothetical protein